MCRFPERIGSYVSLNEVLPARLTKATISTNEEYGLDMFKLTSVPAEYQGVRLLDKINFKGTPHVFTPI